MPAFRASVSDRVVAGERERILVHAPNWLGDAIMSMPAVSRLRDAQAEVELTVLTRRSLEGLWAMQAGVARVVAFDPGWRGTLRAMRALRAFGFDRAYVLPNSVRSALIVRGAGIPRRVGRAGQWRRGLLTSLVPSPAGGLRHHQMWETFEILGVAPGVAGVAEPLLRVDPARCRELQRRVGGVERTLVGLLPGAAYGPAKRWPAERFAAVGRRVAAERRARVLVCGTAAERELCEVVRSAVGGDALNLAGETGLPALAAVLSLCRAVVANDSGGMHLAAAVGTPVVALFGITDPVLTGPIGRGHRVLQASGVVGGRDLERDSAGARAALAALSVEAVVAALDAVWAGEAA